MTPQTKVALILLQWPLYRLSRNLGLLAHSVGAAQPFLLDRLWFPHLLSQYLLNRTRTRIFCSLRPGLPCTVLTRKLEANIIHQLLGMAHDQSRDPNQHYPEPSGVPGSLFLTCGCRTRRRHKQLDCHSSCHGRETLPPTVHRAMRLPCGHLVTAHAYKQDSTTKSRRLSVGHHRQALSPAKADRLSERGPGIVAWKSPITSLKITCCRMALPCFAAHAGAGNDRFCHVDPDRRLPASTADGKMSTSMCANATGLATATRHEIGTRAGCYYNAYRQEHLDLVPGMSPN